MRQTITYILVFLFSIVVNSQTTISGNVSNFGKRKIVLKGHNYKKNIRFNTKENTFSKTLKNIKTGHYILKFRRRSIPIYLENGKNTNINFEFKDLQTIPDFSGPNKEINTYLSKKKNTFSEILGNANHLFSLDESTFLTNMSIYKKALEKLSENSNLPNKYKQFEKRNIFYGYVRNIHNYENYHKTLTRDNTFEVSGSYPNYIKEINFNKASDYHLSIDYKMLMRDYFYKVANKSGGDYNLNYLNEICKKVKSKKIKNDLIFEITQKGIIETAEPKKLYKKFIQNSTNKSNNKKITSLYNKLNLISKGKTSPTFNDYQNYAGGKTSLSDLVAKKKYTYIYLWATWCSYCKKEIAKLDDFREKCDMSKIQFVGINVDNAKKVKKWRRMVAEKGMKGTQLFSGKEHFKLDFAKQYLVQGIPRFILLDPNGKIVSANTPRPLKKEKELTKLFSSCGVIK